MQLEIGLKKKSQTVTHFLYLHTLFNLHLSELREGSIKTYFISVTGTIYWASTVYQPLCNNTSQISIFIITQVLQDRYHSQFTGEEAEPWSSERAHSKHTATKQQSWAAIGALVSQAALPLKGGYVSCSPTPKLPWRSVPATVQPS